MSDPFAANAPGLTSPVTRAFTITPHDDNDLAIFPRGFMVSTAGNMVAILQGDTASVTIPLAAGVMHSIRVRRILASGTSVGTIVGFY
jgi:hypothetical protein